MNCQTLTMVNGVDKEKKLRTMNRKKKLNHASTSNEFNPMRFDQKVKF